MIEVWGSAFKTELDNIFGLQKRVMRLTTFNNVYPSTPGPLNPTEPIFVHGVHDHSTRSNFKVNDGIIINNLKVYYISLYS